MPKLLELVAAASLCTFLSIPGTIGVAADTGITSERNARQKINIAGRQRMLSQRMTAAACLVLADIIPDNRRDAAQTARIQFAEGLEGLRSGSQDALMLAESEPEILASLDVVDGHWATLNAALQQILAHDYHSIAVEQILQLNMTVLMTSDAAVRDYVRVYGAGIVDERMAKTLNVAGRQRMLSQKIMKEACFVSLGLDDVALKQSLEQSTAEFEKALLQLRDGDPEAGILEPVTLQQKLLYRNLSNQWPYFRDAMHAITPGNPDNDVALARLAKQADALLKEANRAVGMYLDP